MLNKTLFLSAVCALACGGPESSPDELGSLEQLISGGALVTGPQNATDPFNAVIGFTPHPDELPGCTATKISEGTRDTYVTAAHCVPGVVVNTPIRYTPAIDNFAGSFKETRIRTIFQHPSCLADPDAGSSCLHASRNSYDVAVFTIDKDTGVSALDASPAINNAATGANVSTRMVGYGCDDSSTNDFKKQTVTLTTQGQGPDVSAAMQARYINTLGHPQGCAGDSGGPLFQNIATPKMVGVVSFILTGKAGTADDVTAYTRLANARRWIATPTKVNTVAGGEMGFLLNRETRRCASLDGTAGVTSECSGANQPVDVQYWKLNAIAGTSFFQIQNTSAAKCLVVGIVDGLLGVDTCASSNPSQHWSLTVSSGSVKIQARTVNSFGQTVRCLAVNSSNKLVSERCDTPIATHKWIFHA